MSRQNGDVDFLRNAVLGPDPGPAQKPLRRKKPTKNVRITEQQQRAGYLEPSPRRLDDELSRPSPGARAVPGGPEMRRSASDAAVDGALGYGGFKKSYFRMVGAEEQLPIDSQRPDPPWGSDFQHHPVRAEPPHR